MSDDHAPNDYKIRYLGKHDRIEKGGYQDFADYRFQVSVSSGTCTVAVGISGVWHEPIQSLGRHLAESDLAQLAEAWLKKELQRGYEPFKQTNSVDLSSQAIEHYLRNEVFP